MLERTPSKQERGDASRRPVKSPPIALTLNEGVSF